MREKLSILFVEPPPARRVGGIETALRSLAAALRELGLRVTRSAEPTPSLVAQHDVIHFHGLWEYSHRRARNWGRQLRKPLLVSPHGMLEDWAFRHRGWKKRPYFHLFERRSLARADVLLATSNLETGPLLRWFPSEKIRVLPLGGHPPAALPPHAEARAQLDLGPEEFVVLFLSRCHEKKGLHLLIEALPDVARQASGKIRLLVVGDGDPSYVEPLRRATAEWRAALRCTWIGAVWGEEKWSYLSAADLLCLPSFSENFGLAILEALFAGTPVLTTPETPWPALRGSLPLYFTRPARAELGAALRERIHAPPTSEADRAAARREAEQKFNWSTVAPRYAELYAELAAAR